MKVFMIAEIGINHNGKLETALELIERAKEAGYDAVKFQKRDPSIYGDNEYFSPVLEQMTTYRRHKEALELNEQDYMAIDAYCKSLGIEWFASCFDHDSVEFIAQFSPKTWKIASPCMLELDLVDHIALQKGFCICSTGLQEWEEVEAAMEVILSHKDPSQVGILHCCSEYPTPPEHANLRMIPTIKRAYPSCTVGYSSHDSGVPISVLAIGMGARIIETHITLDRAMKGSDHAASLEFRGMETLVKYVRTAEKAFGSTIKQVYETEWKIREKVSSRRKDK